VTLNQWKLGTRPLGSITEKCVSTENRLIPPCGVMNLEMMCSPAIRTEPRLVRKKSNPACLLVARVTIRGLYSVSCRNIKAFLSVPVLTSPASKKPNHRERKARKTGQRKLPDIVYSHASLTRRLLPYIVSRPPAGTAYEILIRSNKCDSGYRRACLAVYA
jgi:hypothetical protein